MKKHALVMLAVATVLVGVSSLFGQAPPATEGQLQAMDAKGKPLGECPLKRTDVKADIRGLVARVTVTQEFGNPYTDKIEAVYAFPLGASAAVDDMTMKVGDRVIRGLIKPRAEAKAIYDNAKAAGHVASLLDQERPNIFTQSVANIEPGKSVTVTISYVEMLKYADGVYSFVFPMVVGPRYIPGDPTGKQGTGWAPDTNKVPDASKVTPPVTPKGTRAGHDISIAVTLDAGLALGTLESRQHKTTTHWKNKEHSQAKIELQAEREIPNKDFVLEYSTVTDRISDAVLACTDKRGGFFTMVLQPPKKVQPKEIVPREIVFVIDTSGSMSGFPTETSKSIMRKAIKELREKDTFNLITFSGGTRILWDKPRDSAQANRDEALKFLESLQGSGGTEMMKAIDAALAGQHDAQKVRIVAFFTDGFVGNDMAIIDAVQKNAGTSRVFSFGIGRSTNRFLLDNMARAGRGEVEYALDDSQGAKAATRFYDRIDAPVLTDVSIDWGDLAKVVQADELCPRLIPDLFSVEPVVITGRYKPGAKEISGTITLKGKTSEGDFSRKIEVKLPAAGADQGPIASLWARNRIEDLMNKDLLGAQQGKPDPAIKESVMALGLNFRLMTQYTSFVAVEEKTVTVGGQPRTVAVPVEMPEGVSYEGVFGSSDEGSVTVGMLRTMYKRAPGKSMLRGSGGGPYPGVASFASSKPSEGRMSRLAQAEAGKLKDAERIKEIQADTKLTDAQKKDKDLEIKLVKELQGLAARLDKDGNFKSDKLTVVKGKVDVTVYLDDMDEKTLAALTELGFAKTLDSPSLNMVMGSIDVSKLETLALLKTVRHVALPAIVK